MTFLDLMRAPRLAFAPDDSLAGGGDTIAGGADTVAGGAETVAGGGNGGGAKWWQGADYSPDEQQWLAARGLTEDDPAKIVPKLVKGHRAAEQRLGKGLDTIMDRPAKDQPLTDWMRAQKDVFGLPEKAEDYKVERPKELPDTIAWDGEFEGRARTKAFELGLTPDQMNGLVGLYAEQVQGLNAKIAAEETAANDRMMADLTAEFGAQLQPRLALAKQAAAVLGEQAGLDKAAIAAVSSVLTEKAGGSAATIKLFAKIGELMSEDKLVTGASAGAETAAEARQKLAAMQAPDGAYYKAVERARNGDPAEQQRLKPEIERLTRLAAGR